MLQLSFSSFDSLLHMRDSQGHYVLASAEQILAAAREVIDQKMQRGTEFSSPAVVKEYLRTKLSGFEHEVFAVLFLDTRHCLIAYVEIFRGTIDSASVHPREVVKEALRVNAAMEAQMRQLPTLFHLRRNLLSMQANGKLSWE